MHRACASDYNRACREICGCFRRGARVRRHERASSPLYLCRYNLSFSSCFPALELGAIPQVTLAGAPQNSCRPSLSVAALLSRLFFRTALALLLVVAVGSAQAEENGFHHRQRSSKTVRSGAHRIPRSVRGGLSFQQEHTDGVCPFLLSLEQHGANVAADCLAVIEGILQIVREPDFFARFTFSTLEPETETRSASTPYLPNPPPVFA